MIKNYIKRDLYLEKIRPYISKEVIKVVVGQRRVGKSYLLYQIMEELTAKGTKKDDIIYINKELYEFDAVKDYHGLLKYINQKAKVKKGLCVFIDEIQEIKSFEKALRDLLAKGCDVYCSGSNADLLSGELASYLSGRFIQIEVSSLSYLEFIKFHNLQSGEETFYKYIKYGGLPYLINLNLEDAIVYDYLKNIYNTILLKDVVTRYNIRQVALIEKLNEYIADNVGSLVSAKKISDFLLSQKIKISPSVILNYLYFLSAAFLLHKVQRSEIAGKKIFEINEKYYWQDLGLRHSLIGYQQIDINKILENAVYNHLRVSGYKITIGQLIKKEVDFVCERRGEKLYVQVAYLLKDKKTIDREFGNLLEIKDNFPKIVVSMDKMALGGIKGIKHINIIDFLNKYL